MRTDQDKVNLATAIKQALEEWPAQLAVIGYKAKICRARFLALRKEGFTSQEAMMLCLRDVDL